MTFLASFLIFVAVAGLISLLGMKLWVRPKEAIERVTGANVYAEEKAPVHPSLVFREMLDRLGSVLPASPKDMSLIAAAACAGRHQEPELAEGAVWVEGRIGRHFTADYAGAGLEFVVGNDE